MQPVTSFQFLWNTGETSDDRSLPIRGPQHAAGEAARCRTRVLDKVGEILDRETRRVEPIEAGKTALGLTAVVHRARSPADVRAMSAIDAPIHAGREFVRTDRLLIHVQAYGTSAPGATLTARRIDRRGATLVPLSMTGLSVGWYLLDFPLASIAAGDYAVVIEGQNGDARADAVVPLRVRRSSSG